MLWCQTSSSGWSEDLVITIQPLPYCYRSTSLSIQPFAHYSLTNTSNKETFITEVLIRSFINFSKILK